ncbi:unnamed protein product [Rotaria sordida]|uniref:MULE transposase domain-containing protein n=1 Tax=Rotaria sordida TaxID=392033 RepID=A0A819JE69_9BILA|nr:unnamed protein product [Rotaria sordida]
MSRRTWHECLSSTSENDIVSFIKENNVSTYRTEHFQVGKTITYRCTEYRKHPLCRFQLKSRESNNKFTLFRSESHDHSQRNDITRLKSPVRDIVRQMSDKGMTQTQIRKTVSYSRLKTRKNIISIDDLQKWCNQYLNCPSSDKLHDIFVPYYEAIDVDHIFICITARQLLSMCKYSSILAIDCTYKITWNELPLLVFGTSDFNRHFHPLGLCLISTDEAADTFKTLFRVLKSCVPLIIQQPYDITHVMADGAPGITSAMCELPNARRLMCWAHVIRKCREHRKLVLHKEKWLAIEKDIYNLQLVFNDHLFDKAARLMIMKWTADKDLDTFRKYFEDQWLLSLPFWYEGSANLIPSTNNGIESFNGKIKQMYTLRNKLSLSLFLQTAERMLYDWSLASIGTPFAIQIEFNDDLAARAYKWLQKLDRTKVLHLGATSYVVPSSEPKMDTLLWVQHYHSISWNSYDEFIDWSNSAR